MHANNEEEGWVGLDVNWGWTKNYLNEVSLSPDLGALKSYPQGSDLHIYNHLGFTE